MDILQELNPAQREAASCTEGPLLVLAGAGSGKTRMLTHRIAYLIQEKDVKPWHILALTFTNKAAGEMRDRVQDLVGSGAEMIWVSTFHSACVRILRRNADCLGYASGFSIYDADDQRALMKQIIRRLNLDPKQYRERAVLAAISSAKNEGILPDAYERQNMDDYRAKKIAQLYREYQKSLLANNAMDFDDLLLNTVQLFRTAPDVLEDYRDRFHYILIDEYQDTNTVQFELVRLLAEKRRNLCAVGDDDQSIYRFRGANIRNILDFEKSFPDAKVIRLEQNYRSTKRILDCANAVIRNNRGRKEKKLWTENPQGRKVRFREYNTARDEAEGIIRDIVADRERYSYGKCAVLYRTNAQSRLLEERCVSFNVPYRLVGGVNFYQRKEIKDIICYLKTIANGKDDLAVERVINVPRRGIGAVTLAKAQDYAGMRDISLYEALTMAEDIPGLGRAAARKVEGFVNQIRVLRAQQEFMTVQGLIQQLLESTGYQKELEGLEPVERDARLANVQEFISKAADFGDEPGDSDALSRFLEEVALVAEVDSVDAGDDRVILMTLHSAKGLEFPKVYLAGMEEGLFPSFLSMQSGNPDDIEEERRLCYVGITRAREELTLTAAHTRMVNGETRYNAVSRFVQEIPPDMLDISGKGAFPGSAGRFGTGYGAAGRSGNSGYSAGKTSGSATPPAFGREFKVEKADHLDYAVGDRVSHSRFGEGTVRQITEKRRDYEVVVDFDGAGSKTLYASLANLQKL